MTGDRAMGLRGFGAALPLLLAACASQPQLLERPDRVWASPRGLDATAACVIRVLDDRGSGLPAGPTHAKHVIEPGRVYEIRPDQDGAVTPETYSVRLEKAGGQITRMSLFVDSPWEKNMIRALSPCGTR
ncbi:MAG: hypothetical protein AB7F09_04960 [Parvibaculaceae bacterium]